MSPKSQLAGAAAPLCRSEFAAKLLQAVRGERAGSISLPVMNDSPGLSPGGGWKKAFQRRGHAVGDLDKPGVHPEQRVLLKGEVRGKLILKEGPRLEALALVWEPAMGPWAGAAEAWGLTPSTEHQKEFRSSCLSSQLGLW